MQEVSNEAEKTSDVGLTREEIKNQLKTLTALEALGKPQGQTKSSAKDRKTKKKKKKEDDDLGIAFDEAKSSSEEEDFTTSAFLAYTIPDFSPEKEIKHKACVRKGNTFNAENYHSLMPAELKMQIEKNKRGGDNTNHEKNNQTTKIPGR